MTPAAGSPPGPRGYLPGPGRHLPGLDGLRGLAVAAVLAYHLWPAGVPGGWLGVSIFFTLSGFLVVGLLDHEVSTTGAVDLGRFWRRRSRRLLPAVLVTITGVVLVTAVAHPVALERVAGDALAGVGYVANWRLAAASGGYGALFDGAVRPLDHLWSLAVEEQFYLLVALAVAAGRLMGPRLTRLGAVVVVASVLGSVVWWWGDPDAYLVTPVRIGEILAGAALAVALRRGLSLGWASPLALPAAVVASALVLTVGQDDPRVVRGLLPGVGLLWVLLVAGVLVPGPLRSVCSWRPLGWLGRRSYAVYLLHWPLVVFTSWPWWSVLAVTGIGAEVSGRLLEDPVREGRRIRRPLPVFGAAMAAVAVLALVVGSLATAPVLPDTRAAVALPSWYTRAAAAPAPTAPPPGAAAPAAPAPLAAVPSPAGAPVVEPDAAAPGSPTAGGAPEGVGVPIVDVVGDSTAAVIGNALRSRADATRQAAVVLDAIWGCSPLMTGELPWRTVRSIRDELSFDVACRTVITDGVASREPAPDLVLVVDHGTVLLDHRRPDGTWASVLDADLGADLTAAYAELADAVASRGGRLVLTTAPPADWPGDPSSDPARARAYADIVTGLARRPDVELVDVADLLIRRPDLDRRDDGVHLDGSAADGLAAVLLELLVGPSGRVPEPAADGSGPLRRPG